MQNSGRALGGTAASAGSRASGGGGERGRGACGDRAGAGIGDRGGDRGLLSEGTGYERTAAAVVEAFGPEIELALEHPLDFKSALQELLARRGAEVSYEITGETGPPHDRTFAVVAKVDERSGAREAAGARSTPSRRLRERPWTGWPANEAGN